MAISSLSDVEPNKFIPLNNPDMFNKVFSDEEHIGLLEYFISHILKIPLEDVQGNVKLAKNGDEKSNQVDVIFNNKGKLIIIQFFMNEKPNK